MKNPSALVKVQVAVQPSAWHAVATETLWASPVSPRTARLQNSPFYAKGYSNLDLVSVTTEGTDELPVVGKVLEPSGHSTYVLWVKAGVEVNAKFTAHWQPLEELGCTYEGLRGELLSVDVPASSSINEAYRLMQAGEDADAWQFMELNVGHRNAA